MIELIDVNFKIKFKYLSNNDRTDTKLFSTPKTSVLILASILCHRNRNVTLLYHDMTGDVHSFGLLYQCSQLPTQVFLMMLIFTCRTFKSFRL